MKLHAQTNMIKNYVFDIISGEFLNLFDKHLNRKEPHFLPGFLHHEYRAKNWSLMFLKLMKTYFNRDF